MEPEFWSDLHQNLMQPFPHPNDASDKIWLESACLSRRYSCLKVWTDAWTPARVPSYKLTLWAFSSGELKISSDFYVIRFSIRSNSDAVHAVSGYFKYFPIFICNTKTNTHFQEIYTDVVVQQYCRYKGVFFHFKWRYLALKYKMTPQWHYYGNLNVTWLWSVNQFT